MSTKDKLRERFLKMPSDFTFDEMQQLLAGYGYEKGNISKYADQLPNGEWMTKQCFWFNNTYIKDIIEQ